MARRIANTASDIRRQGSEDLFGFYMNELEKGLEELSITDDERLMDNKIEDFGIEQFPAGFQPYNGLWRYEPVDSQYFCDKYLGEKPTPKQQEFMDVVCGVDPFDFTNLEYNEADLMWGKGSGKDATSAKTFVYQSYKLACLINPQHFLGLGKGSPIDLVNVASNSNQAKNIFFKYLSTFIKECKDPNTGYNWFATKNFWFDFGKRDFKYMDLREKDGDIKLREITFGRNITCHSLTSDRFTAEGMTIVLAIMDEIGAMRPENIFGDLNNDRKVVGQYRSLGTSVRRSSKYGKLVCISYKYGRNCPMTILVKKNKLDPRKFVRVYSTYEVRTDKSEAQLREQFSDDYRADPEVAAMIYECKDPEIETDVFFSNKFILKGAVDVPNRFTVNPFKKKIITTSNVHLGVDGLLEPWFKGDSNYYYTVHADLAKGQIWKNGDAAALVLGHLQEMRVSYDKGWVEYYKKHYGVDLAKYEGELRVGVVLDLVIQLTCTPDQKELRISDVRRFIIDLQEKRKFGLIKVTLDRWGSEETIQELNKHDIDSELLSMDKSYEPWHTMKDYMQQMVWKTYEHPILYRELSELVDTAKKIDHPVISQARFEQEGLERGSKDVADCAAGVTHTLVKELMNGGEVFFG